MGSIVTPSSVAAVTAVSANNTSFAPSIENVEQKLIIIGSVLAAKASLIVANVPIRVYSADEVGSIAGFGSPPHRAAIYAFKGGSGGVATYFVPQAESGTAVVATGIFVFDTVPTEVGIVSIYIAGEPYFISVDADDTVDTMGDKLVAVMAAEVNCPLVGVNTVGSVAMTCKSLGTWGNDVLMTVGSKGEVTPAGVTYTITPMASGANDPDIDDVLTALGTGDSANEDFYTKYLPCYGTLVTGTLDSLSDYNGEGNVAEDCYAETVHRPFVAVFGDTAEDTAGLTAITAIGTARKETDRTNGAISVPGSPNHPCDIAGAAAGIMCRMGNVRAAETYVGQNLPGIIPGLKAVRWTKDYANRDTAAKAGISPTKAVGSVVKMQNMLTFYHPAAVPMASNGYRSMRNITILTNILDNYYNYFASPAWEGVSIVEDVATVTSMIDRDKVRDVNNLVGDLFLLTDLFMGKAWLFSAEWTKEKIGGDVANYVSLRAGGLGFDNKYPIVFSGEGGIINGEVQFDTNLAVVTG